jgi:ubiquinone/menaquinone biosynthesis C-methylase UbiE
MLSVDRRIWDAFARDNAFFHTVSWDAHRAADTTARRAYWESGPAVVDHLIALSGFQPTRNHTALEIGCGLGRLTRPLATRFGSVIGLDISPAMIEGARREAADDAIDRVRFERCDGDSLHPVPDAGIDFVLCFTVFQHLSRRELAHQYVRETARVLRPGGVAVIQCPTWRLAGRAAQGCRTVAQWCAEAMSPMQAYWRMRQAIKLRSAARNLQSRLERDASGHCSAVDLAAAQYTDARRMKAIHLGRFLGWIEAAGMRVTSCRRPNDTYTTFVMAKDR